MARFVILQPPGSEAPQAARVIEDGFSALAFVVTPIWLLWHRLWLEAAAVVLLSILTSVGAQRLGMPALGALLSLLVSLFIGFEGRGLWIAALRRRGWSEWGVIDAANRWEAEARFAHAVVEQPAQEQVADRSADRIEPVFSLPAEAS